MPHQCTECGEIHDDGSDEIFNGCSNCNSETFQFVPQNNNAQENVTKTTTQQQDEDGAQKEARSNIVSQEEIEEATQQETDTTNEEPTNETEQVRQALNNQFESIRICSPGEYELNLMQLYENQDRVISLREDGKYAIHIDDE